MGVALYPVCIRVLLRVGREVGSSVVGVDGWAKDFVAVCQAHPVRFMNVFCVHVRMACAHLCVSESVCASE